MSWPGWLRKDDGHQLQILRLGQEEARQRPLSCPPSSHPRTTCGLDKVTTLLVLLSFTFSDGLSDTGHHRQCHLCGLVTVIRKTACPQTGEPRKGTSAFPSEEELLSLPFQGRAPTLEQGAGCTPSRSAKAEGIQALRGLRGGAGERAETPRHGRWRVADGTLSRTVSLHPLARLLCWRQWAGGAGPLAPCLACLCASGGCRIQTMQKMSTRRYLKYMNAQRRTRKAVLHFRHFPGESLVIRQCSSLVFCRSNDERESRESS